MVKFSLPSLPSFKPPTFKPPTVKPPSLKPPTPPKPPKPPSADAPPVPPTRGGRADVPPTRGGRADVPDVPDASQASRSLSRTALRRCGKNPKTCAGITGVAGLAIYSATKFADNTRAQQNCITDCLPPGWDTGAPEYHAADTTPEGEPRCTGGDCDSVCQTRCEAAHPTTAADVVTDAVTDAVDAALDPILEMFSDVFPVEALTDGVMWILRVALGLVVLYVLSWVMRVVSVVRKLLPGSSSSRSYYPPPPPPMGYQPGYYPPAYAPQPPRAGFRGTARGTRAALRQSLFV